VGGAYAYLVRATDPDGDPLTYSLVTAPAGMSIDATGLVRWSPAATGSYPVTIRVDDGRGGSAEQSYSVVVAATAADRPPVIESAPPLRAVVGHLYGYQVDSCDPDGDAVRFELRQAPAGMGIDASTRMIRWTPGSAQADVAVTVASVDVPGGLAALQTFHLKVTDNQAPTITSTAPGTVTAGLVYRYDVRGADPEGDAVSYRLDQAPEGMTIDQLGRLRWETTADLIGGSPYPVQVTVTDPYGASYTQPFSVAVTPDEEPPRAFFLLGSPRRGVEEAAAALGIPRAGAYRHWAFAPGCCTRCAARASPGRGEVGFSCRGVVRPAGVV
jgi:hypothetical protein